MAQVFAVDVVSVALLVWLSELWTLTYLVADTHWMLGITICSTFTLVYRVCCPISQVLVMIVFFLKRKFWGRKQISLDLGQNI